MSSKKLNIIYFLFTWFGGTNMGKIVLFFAKFDGLVKIRETPL